MSNENDWEDEDVTEAASASNATAPATASVEAEAATDPAGGGRRAARRRAAASDAAETPAPRAGLDPSGQSDTIRQGGGLVDGAAAGARDKLLDIASRYGWTADDEQVLFGHSTVRFTLGDLRALVGLKRPGA